MESAYRRPEFEFDPSLKAARKLWEFNDDLLCMLQRLNPVREAALAPDSFEGSWGVEFRARAEEEDINVSVTRGKLRSDANEWGAAWQRMVNQINNVCWAETYVAAKKLLEEKERQENESKNWLERGAGAVADYFVGKDEVIGSVPTAERATLPRGPGFPRYSDFAHFRVGDPCSVSYHDTAPGPSSETVTGEAAGEAEGRRQSSDAPEVVTEAGQADPLPVTITNDRASAGNAAGICTIDLVKVQKYLSDFRVEIDGLRTLWVDEVVPVLDVARQVCKDSFSLTQSRETVGALFDCFEELHMAVGYVYQLVEPNGDGTGSVSGAVVAEVLIENGLDTAPGVLVPSNTELGGLPENSGLVDDPINAANGNFFHQEMDLGMPGLADAIAIRRTYNAGLPVKGVFGRGWSSVFDMELTNTESGLAMVRTNDGAVLGFPLTEDGNYVPHGARQAQLLRNENGWTLRKGLELEWFFDSAGRLSGSRDGYAHWSLSRDETSLVITELGSGRSVTLDLQDGLVRFARSSDGRTVHYHYVDENLVVVERPTGSMTYEINVDGLIGRIIDADGVLVVENTYDTLRRAVSQLSPFQRMSRYEYGENGLFRSTDDHGGPANVMIHDGRGNLTSMTAGDGLGMRLKWDDRNRMTERRDRNGNVTTYSYLPDPARDLLVSHTGPDGESEDREWDDVDRLITLVLPDGGIYQLTYDGDHRLPATVTDPLGGVTQYERNKAGQVTRETDPDGVVVTFAWTIDGQIERITDADGDQCWFDYDVAGCLTQVTSDGRTAQFASDAGGRVSTIDSVDGVHRAMTYTAAGRPLACHDAQGELVWRLEYGSHGLASSLVDGDQSKSMSVEYDRYGNHTRIVGVDGVEADFVYDELNQLRSLDLAGVTVLSQSHDGNGNRVSVTDADGLTASRTVDASDRTKSITDPLGNVTTMTWHQGGQLASMTRADGATYEYTVDQLGRVISVTGPDGAITRYEYSNGGRLTARVSGAGRRTEYGYGAAGKLTTETDADGVVRSISADDATLTITDGDEMVTFTLDDTGRIASWDHAGGSSGTAVWGEGERSVAYADTLPAIVELDRSGLASRVTTPAGAVTELERDLRNRIVATVSGTERTEFSYDMFANLVSASDDMSEPLELDYSPGGRVVAARVGDESPIVATRDAAGRVINLTCDNELVADYSYDAAGIVVQATNSNGTARADVDAYGSLTAMHDLNGNTTTYERDLDGLVTGIASTDGTGFTIDRSAAGRIISYRTGQNLMAAPGRWDEGASKDNAGRITVDREGRTHRYDEAGRLIESIASGGQRWAFVYGPNGMIESEASPLLGDRVFTYNVGGQIATVTGADGTTAYTYDHRGRRVSEVRGDGSSVEFAWDVLDRLVGVTQIDSQGNRLSRTIAYSAYGRAERVDDNEIVWDDALSHKPLRVGDATYFRSGMFTAEVGAAAGWDDGTVDDPFGYTGQTGVRLGFRGELEVDGLVLMGARVYDPATRTFLSKDPAALVLTAPAGQNSYQYAYCDPVNNVDPSGRTVLTTEDFADWVDRQHNSRFGSFVNAVQEDPWGAVAVVAVVVVAVAAIVLTGGLAGPFIVGGVAGTMLAAGGTAALVTVGFTAASQFHGESYDLQGMAAQGAVSFVAGAAGAGLGGAATAGFARFATFAGPRGATTAANIANNMSVETRNPLVQGMIEETTAGFIEGVGNEFIAQVHGDDGWNFGDVNAGSLAGEGLFGGVTGFVSAGVNDKVDGLLPNASSPLVRRARQAVVGGTSEGIVSTGAAVVRGEPVTVGSVVSATAQGAVGELIMGGTGPDVDTNVPGTVGSASMSPGRSPDVGTAAPANPAAGNGTNGSATAGTGPNVAGPTPDGGPEAASGSSARSGGTEPNTTPPSGESAETASAGTAEPTTAETAETSSPDQPDRGSSTEQPSAEQPVAEQPAAQEPVAEAPAAQEPVAEEPTAEEPVPEESTVEEPVAEEPVAEEPAGDDATAEEPVTEEATVEDPAPENPIDADPTGNVDIIHMQDDPTAIERLGGDPVVEARTSMVQGPDGEVNRVTWGIDADGNTVVAEFDLSEVFEGADRSSAENTATRTLDGKEPGDHGGHIAGHRFMLDQGQTNMFAQNGNFNTGAYAKLENEFADMIERGATVQGTVRFDGFNDAGRPSEIIIEYTAYDANGTLLHTRGVKEPLEFDNETGQTYDRVYGDEIDERIAS